jgi:hypothetical protein
MCSSSNVTLVFITESVEQVEKKGARQKGKEVKVTVTWAGGMVLAY